MLAEERRKQILNILQKEGSIKVSKMSKIFKVTKETIRRDLDKLARQHLLKRTHGGAVSLDNENEISFNIRKHQNIEEKIQIANKAIKFIEDGDTIFLDISSTVMFFAQKLRDFNDLTVITNSAVIIHELANYDNITVIATGGILRPSSLSFVGPIANETVQKYYADKFFVSCKGISPKYGITDSNDLENQIKMNMVERAKKTILLVDHSKFNIIGMARFADIDDIDIIISDDKLSKEEKNRYVELNKEIY